MKDFDYVVRLYTDGMCYDSKCFKSLEQAKKSIVGSPRATIVKCTNAQYKDNFEGWVPSDDGVNVPTGRKCDI